MNTQMADQITDIVRLATLAPSGHNTQPWKFIIHQNSIQLHPDLSRHLAMIDAQDREMWISLGCALENLVLAAHAAGFTTEVTYPDATEYIGITLAADSVQKDALYDAIPVRQNTRSLYDGQPVASSAMDQLQSMALEPGVNLQFVLSRAALETLVEYVNQGNLEQYGDRAFKEELIHWMRFNKKEALASPDGLYTLCTGNPQIPRWLGQLFIRGMKPQQQVDVDARRMRSASGAVVIISETDTRSAWVRTGQVYERLALKTTALNIKSSLFNQPFEVAGIRTQFQAAMNLGLRLPQLLMRFGYSDPMPRSFRRPVSQVIQQA